MKSLLHVNYQNVLSLENLLIHESEDFLAVFRLTESPQFFPYI